jgi:hypothetical protein
MTYMQSPSGEVFTTDNPEYHKDCKKLTIKAGKVARKEYARSELRKLITPGQTVYCTLRSVSSSGMSRTISLHIIDNGTLRGIDNLAADATDTKRAKRDGLIMGGCGMDMGFALVYSLGYALWPNGTPKPHGVRNGTPDSDGGYALKHSWV